MGNALAARPGFGPANLRARRDERIRIVEPTAPFDFDLTLGSFASFAASGPAGVERYSTGRFGRVLRVENRLYLVGLTDGGTPEDPRVGVEVWPRPSAADEREVQRQCRWMMAAELRLEAFYAIAARCDPVLSAVISRLRGLRQPRTPDAFEALVTAVTEQLTSIKTAATLRARLVERYGERLVVEGEERQERREYIAFPTAAALAAAEPDEIRGMGLLGNKARCIVSVARAVTDRALDLAALAEAPVDEIGHVLGAIKGIGPWTIAYVLGRGFGRYELVPEGDVALRAAAAKHYGRAAATDRDVREVLAPFGEWKGLAAFYLIVDYAIARYRILQRPLAVYVLRMVQPIARYGNGCYSSRR